MRIHCRSHTLTPEMNVSNGDETYYYNSYLFMYMLIELGNAGGVTGFCFIWREPWNQSLGTWAGCASCRKIIVQSNWNLFHVDQANRDGGGCFSLWTLSRRGALFKHEWASDSRQENTRGLIITAEYNNSVVGLKSPSRGVTLDLIKCCMYRLPGLLLIAIPFSAAFAG